MSVVRSLVPPEKVDLAEGSNPRCFEVHYGESQWGRQIEAKIKACDIQDVVDWVEKTYTAYEWLEIDIASDDTAYMMINPCPACDLNELDKPLEDNPCEHCEISMYFDIYATDDDTDSLNLIFPTCHSEPKGLMKHDAYHDLTK